MLDDAYNNKGVSGHPQPARQRHHYSIGWPAPWRTRHGCVSVSSVLRDSEREEEETKGRPAAARQPPPRRSVETSIGEDESVRAGGHIFAGPCAPARAAAGIGGRRSRREAATAAGAGGGRNSGKEEERRLKDRGQCPCRGTRSVTSTRSAAATSTARPTSTTRRPSSMASPWPASF
ncbi:hypothetical protein PVAP13_1NG548300 [Panicum virgatum]|uniref:Uncharacterized protein n=1 Tax=Panicum virgatum TaxID=38727 RepID=A0A8T0X8A2_PANVG|nr:hypothetical protein PVAP13_1NG548300 [Panicum virgatum]